MLDAGRWTLDSERWTLDVRLWTLDAGLRMLDSGRWTLDTGCWILDAELLTLDSGFCTLYSGLWTLSLTVVEQNQNAVSGFCLIKLLKILWVRTSKDHGHACSVETIGSDVAVSRNSILTLSVTL